jgi:hypothetical protein
MLGLGFVERFVTVAMRPTGILKVCRVGCVCLYLPKLSGQRLRLGMVFDPGRWFRGRVILGSVRPVLEHVFYASHLRDAGFGCCGDTARVLDAA